MPVATYRVTGPVWKWVVRMEATRLSALSREQVRFPVYADADGAPIDPTPYTVEVALKGGDSMSAEPESGDWKAAAWAVTATGNYVAGVEVGPGSAAGALTPGRWRCWVRITETDPGTEQVVRQAGQIVVY